MGKLFKNQKGMTLIEIMIVLVILGTIGTVLVTKVIGNLKKARFNEAKILISETGKALDQFYTDCGFYPTSEQGLNALVQNPTGRACPNWGPESYLKRVPKDPWNNPLAYTCSDGLHYVIKSFGADRQEGGEGFNADISSEDL